MVFEYNCWLWWLSWMCVWLLIRKLWVRPPAGSATFFRGDWSWNIFYGHSLPSADSKRAVVSFWQKNVHNTGQLLRGLSLPSKSVVRQTYCAHDGSIGLIRPKTSTQINKYFEMSWFHCTCNIIMQSNFSRRAKGINHKEMNPYTLIFLYSNISSVLTFMQNMKRFLKLFIKLRSRNKNAFSRMTKGNNSKEINP